MANEKRLIDADVFWKVLDAVEPGESSYYGYTAGEIEEALYKTPTVDAVEVVHIEKAKQEILQGFDVLISEYRHISQSSNDYFGIKADAMEIARRLVNAALNDLCPNCGAKMDGDGNG